MFTHVMPMSVSPPSVLGRWAGGVLVAEISFSQELLVVQLSEI